jgi:hypothetical protein
MRLPCAALLDFFSVWEYAIGKRHGEGTMFESMDIRHWLVIALLILVNVVIFGFVILLLAGKIALF